MFGYDENVMDEDGDQANGEQHDDDSDDSDFREYDEEKEEEGLFLPHPKLDKQTEDEIRDWMGKQLGRDFENLNFDNEDEQVSEYEDSEALMSLSESDGEDEEGRRKRKRFPEFNEYICWVILS